jgi:hypothetical protein
MATQLTTVEINALILANEAKPYKLPDGNTYLNGDCHLAVMEKRMDLKMLRCIEYARRNIYDATAEELYAIAPDYFGDKKICWGMGHNQVTQDLHHLPGLDHKYPRSKGGPNTIDNLVFVPRIYNIWKRDIVKEDWIQFKEWMDNHLDS